MFSWKISRNFRKKQSRVASTCHFSKKSDESARSIGRAERVDPIEAKSLGVREISSSHCNVSIKLVPRIRRKRGKLNKDERSGSRAVKYKHTRKQGAAWRYAPLSLACCCADWVRRYRTRRQHYERTHRGTAVGTPVGFEIRLENDTRSLYPNPIVKNFFLLSALSFCWSSKRYPCERMIGHTLQNRKPHFSLFILFWFFLLAPTHARFTNSGLAIPF